MIKKILSFLIVMSNLSSLQAVSSLNGSNALLPGNTPVNKTAFLMAHNASTAGWLIYRQQTKDIKTLLETYGVRGLKVPIHWYSKKGVVGRLTQVIGIGKTASSPPYIALCHEDGKGNNCTHTLLQKGGRSPKPATEFFKVLADYLASNSEVIILRLDSNLYGPKACTAANGAVGMTDDQVTAALEMALKESGLAHYAYKFTGTWPTLGQLRGSGKRLIIFTDEDRGSIYLNSTSGNLRQSHWKDEKRAGCMMSKKDGQMFEVNINYQLSINEKSLAGAGMKLYNLFKRQSTSKNNYDYNQVNSTEAAVLRILECTEAQPDKLVPNIISSDFVDKGDLVKLVDCLNGHCLIPLISLNKLNEGN